jgi:antitoxin component YwqK of YwqJK toxin-antitoxin module
MRTLILIAALFLAAPWVRSQLAGERTQATHWPNGQLQTLQTYRYGLSGEKILHGRHAMFSESGTPLVEGAYRHGTADGSWQWWYEDGTKRAECVYREGQGNYVSWHPNGKIFLRGTYQNGKRIGLWTEYYPSGRKRLQGEYREDRQHGTWTGWTDSSPSQAAQSEWRDGERVK